MRSITHTNLWNKRRRNEREKPYTEENTCLAKPTIPSNQTIDRLRAQVRSPRFNTCAIYLCMYTVRVRRANSPRRRFDSEIFTVRQLTCVPHSRFLRYCYSGWRCYFIRWHGVDCCLRGDEMIFMRNVRKAWRVSNHLVGCFGLFGWIKYLMFLFWLNVLKVFTALWVIHKFALIARARFSATCIPLYYLHCAKSECMSHTSVLK